MNNLVCINHRDAVTTTLKVAEVFSKRHDRVIETVRNILIDLPEGVPFFRETSYIDLSNREQIAYEMNRDGFSLLAMGFTGKRALEFKLKYIDAFNLMEKTLLQQHNPSWQQQRLEGKVVRRELTDALRDFVDYATSQGSINARFYYQNITKLTYMTLFFVKEASPKNFRDVLDTMHNTFLAAAEYTVRQAILDGMTQQLHYKDIYILVKERVTSYASTLPIQRLICK